MVRPALIGTVTDVIRRAYDRYRNTHAPDREAHAPAADGATKIEWGIDLESLTFRGTDWDGPP